MSVAATARDFNEAVRRGARIRITVPPSVESAASVRWAESDRCVSEARAAVARAAEYRARGWSNATVAALNTAAAYRVAAVAWRYAASLY